MKMVTKGDQRTPYVRGGKGVLKK